MTCERFREMITLNVRDLTRAERAAVVAHHRSCPDCRAVVLGLNAADPMSESHRALAKRFINRDLADPEFRAVVDPEGRLS
jgi:hypothetical protein